jgi:hypothetical protein
MKEKPKIQEDDYGKPRQGINPLTGKPRGPSRLREAKDTDWLAIISSAEPEVEDQTPPPDQPTA